MLGLRGFVGAETWHGLAGGDAEHRGAKSCEAGGKGMEALLSVVGLKLAYRDLVTEELDL